MGVEFQTQVMELDGKEIKAQVWDIAGQERFCVVTSNYYRGTVGALVVYDITRWSTFDCIKRWLDELKSGLLAVGSNLAWAYLQQNNFKSLEKLYYATDGLYLVGMDLYDIWNMMSQVKVFG
ncbi:ras-related protein RABA5e-like [Camellia sinensis]|uniref:ras-related protein RABA5e-like n=1 Tax=Camellia sinensis TaxID=4442 RepID=UPI001035FB50|nr:ras-related protein RABA5e-like [Camellia sinensis]